MKESAGMNSVERLKAALKERIGGKVRDKIDRYVRKQERKAKAWRRGECACLAAAVAIAAACGCQSVPSRSQTLTLRDCTVYVYGGGGATNAVPAVEIATQSMLVENSGTETLNPSQTTDVKPDVDVSVGAAKGGGILETAAAKLLDGGGSASPATAPVTEPGDCPDGNCSD